MKRTPLRDARSDEIPVIDVSSLFSDARSDRKVVADAIHNAATNNGFFYIKNHGIPDSTVQSAYRTSLEFFRQPTEVKELVNVSRSKSFNGWKPPKTQRINAAESIDIRESFSFTYNPIYDPAVSEDLTTIPDEVKSWVTSDGFCWEQTSNLPEFKSSIIKYWRATVALGRQLTRSFALDLSLLEDHFDAKVQ
jgi:isopenicillin N synthase-like dioxygenase